MRLATKCKRTRLNYGHWVNWFPLSLFFQLILDPTSDQRGEFDGVPAKILQKPRQFMARFCYRFLPCSHCNLETVLRGVSNQNARLESVWFFMEE
jgi:hypothetical protein